MTDYLAREEYFARICAVLMMERRCGVVELLLAMDISSSSLDVPGEFAVCKRGICRSSSSLTVHQKS